MKIVRRGIFETNSSSSHSVSIATGSLSDLLPVQDGTVRVSCGEFGWGYETHTDSETKLSYLVTSLFQKIRADGCTIEKDIKIVKKSNKFLMLQKVIKEWCNAKIEVVSNMDYYMFGYIDHQSSGVPDEVFVNKETIANFLFNPHSILVIDNDNH